MLAASLGAPGRRSLPALVAVTALFVLLLGGSVRPVHAADPCDPSIANRIPCENSKPGNPASEWDISGSGDASIQGFATDISYNHGGMVSFKVSTPASAYTVSIY